MCTYSLTFDDKLMDSVRPSFKSEKAMNEWMQSNMTLLLMQFVAEQNAKTKKHKYSGVELEVMLADHPSLAEDNISDENGDYRQKVMQLCGAWNDDTRTTEQIKEDIRSVRISNETRQTREWPV